MVCGNILCKNMLKNQSTTTSIILWLPQTHCVTPLYSTTKYIFSVTFCWLLWSDLHVCSKLFFTLVESLCWYTYSIIPGKNSDLWTFFYASGFKCLEWTTIVNIREIIIKYIQERHCHLSTRIALSIQVTLLFNLAYKCIYVNQFLHHTYTGFLFSFHIKYNVF